MTTPAKAKREHHHPSILSSYRRLWRGTRWAVFLEPRPGSKLSTFDGALKSSYELGPIPGVYEFAVTQGRSTRRIKVYVGETGSLKARHAQYLCNGDHLKPLFEAALRDGCTIWRRWRYMATKEQAVRMEAQLLGQLDYAWNARLNGKKRSLALQQRWCCFCVATGVDILESEYQSPVKASRPRSPQKAAQASPQRKPRASKQLQFIASTA